MDNRYLALIASFLRSGFNPANIIERDHANGRIDDETYMAAKAMLTK